MLLILRGAQYLIPSAITFVIVAVFAFAYHELAHAVVADRLGDYTPRSVGRMTLNPIPHLDRTGFILLMIIGFGWATTPVNPHNMRGNPRTSMAIVSISGPLANLLMAALLGLPILMGIVDRTPPGTFLPSLYSFLALGVYYNLLLMAFNLIPIPPLDGFSVLLGVLPAEISHQLRGLQQYSQTIFLLVFFVLPVMGFNIAFSVINPVIRTLFPLLLGGNASLFV